MSRFAVPMSVGEEVAMYIVETEYKGAASVSESVGQSNPAALSRSPLSFLSATTLLYFSLRLTVAIASHFRM